MSAGTRHQRRRRRAGQPPSAGDAAVHGVRTATARCHWWLGEYGQTPQVACDGHSQNFKWIFVRGAGRGDGSVAAVLRLEVWKTISLVFDTFSFKLFLAVQVATLSISSCQFSVNNNEHFAVLVRLHVTNYTARMLLLVPFGWYLGARFPDNQTLLIIWRSSMPCHQAVGFREPVAINASILTHKSNCSFTAFHVFLA